MDGKGILFDKDTGEKVFEGLLEEGFVRQGVNFIKLFSFFTDSNAKKPREICSLYVHYLRIRLDYIWEGSIVALNYIRLVKKLFREKHSSFFCFAFSDEEKRFIKLTPGPNVIKLFTSVIQKCWQ
jgi:hypothetical protein